MKASDFRELKQVVTMLPPKQKDELEEMLLHPEAIPEIVKLFEQKAGNCPHCHHSKSYRWGTSNGRQRYRCKYCQKTFNALSGTELNGLHKLELIDKYVETMMESKTLRKAAKECGINLKTAFNWRHKLLSLGDLLKSERFDGIVEIDETIFKLSEKGSRHIAARKPRRRGTDKATKVKVVLGMDRSGHIAEQVVERFTLAKLKAEIFTSFETSA